MARNKIKSATDQRPFIALKKYADSNNQCFPSLKKLADVTKISKRKVQDILKSLKKKNVIGIKSRSRVDGGDTSNLYILYDYRELWQAGSSDDIATVVDLIEEKRMIETLTAKGYIVTKEKELASDSDQTADTSTSQNNLSMNKDTTVKTKSQDLERYTVA